MTETPACRTANLSSFNLSVFLANFGCSLIMGFFSNDRNLFPQSRGSKKDDQDGEKMEDNTEASSQSAICDPVDPQVVRAQDWKTHAALRR